MSQNFNQKELARIRNSIEDGMSKIDRLLEMLSAQQLLTSKKLIKQSVKKSADWSDNEAQQQQRTIQLNETRQQTSYNNSQINTMYSFQPTWDQDHQEILLDEYNHYDQKFVKLVQLEQPKIMIVSTTSNWINNYLDENDAIVKIELEDEVKIINSIEKGFFQCTSLNDGGSSVQKQFISSQQIYKSSQLFVEFPYHLKGYQLSLEVESKKYIYEVAVQQKCRVLIQCPNQDMQLIRFLLIKTQGDSYDIIWGAYAEQSIFESLILESGTYILMPLPGGKKCNFYVEECASLSFKKDTETSLKSFNLLKNTFQECRQFSALKRTLSLSFNEDDIKKQFTRSCYMNYGIILEIYENIYEHQAKFVDTQHVKEDIHLLFKDIYTQEQIQHRFSPEQKCIQFYKITKKPANLFIPKKRVLMGNQFMENQVYHAVFK